MPAVLLDTGPWVAVVAEACQLLTLDSDFTIYRRHGRKLIPPHLPLTATLPAGLGTRCQSC